VNPLLTHPGTRADERRMACHGPMDSTAATKRRVDPTSSVRWSDTTSFSAWLISYLSPSRPVTYCAGQCRPSWFDIRSLPPGYDEWDDAGVASSVAAMEGLIQAEVHHGADPRRIILMGFSQGAALSLLVGLTTLHELGGVISLSGWIPHRGREVSMNINSTNVMKA
jgi:predicted esterase